MRRDAGREAGFSLIEVLVSLAVTGIALGAAFFMFGAALRSNVQAERTTIATLIAESKLAEAGIAAPLQLGRATGRTGDGYAWATEVRAYRPPGDDDVAQLPVRAFEVLVTVAWGDDGRNAVSFRTVRLRPRTRDE